jgi:hypothetical protein
MRDFYGPFDHPHIVDLPAEAPTHLLDEMDKLAGELREHPKHIDSDDEIAFRQLQRLRRPELSVQQFPDLFELWKLHYRMRQAAETAARPAKLAALWAERDALFEQRASSSSSAERDAATARIEAIGRELAELVVPHSADMLSVVSVRTE